MTLSDIVNGLCEALAAHDYDAAAAGAREFVEALESGAAIDSVDGHRALDALRCKRMFDLLGRVAEALIAANMGDARVCRQLAQVRIEQKRFDEARALLNGILRAAAAPPPPGPVVARARPDGDDEADEARGLLGRLFKQMYVDGAVPPGGAGAVLEQAIEAYLSGYDRNRERNTWHGINAASLLRRAERDGRALSIGRDAAEIAADVLASIKRRERKEVWDLATAAEAALALGDPEGALSWIETYSAQRNADTFELTATTRQFVEVLQLEDVAYGAPILARLRAENLKRSGGGFIPQALNDARADAGKRRATSAPARIPILLRVSDPDWTGNHIPDLVIVSRLGTIIGAQASERSIEATLRDPAVVALESSRPGGTADTAVTLGQTGVRQAHASVGEFGAGALIAIIDSGVDVLHRAFLDDAGNSRIVAYWDQRAEGDDGPWPKAGGRLYTASEIAGFVENPSTLPPALGRRINEHGTHVASIAAGRACGAFQGGVAPQAKILVVATRLNTGPDDPQSLGYSLSHMNALQFIDDMATRLGLPVVVNVSQGQNAGAHDGSSLLEHAFDRFSEARRETGRVVVKAAGNERTKRSHAKVTVQPMSIEKLHWVSPGNPGLPDILELWFDSASEVSISLSGPLQERAGPVSHAQTEVSGTFSSGNTFSLGYDRYFRDNGDSRVRLMLQPGSAASVTPGRWTLEITSAGCVRGPIHAWVERYGTSPTASFENHFDEEMTLSIPGTARTVITVGAIGMRPDGLRQVGDFSSYGPTRDEREKPDIAAPGVDVFAARSGTDDDVRMDSGTSMAAPHVAGAIALLLSRRPHLNAAQVQRMLRNHAASAAWDRGQGYGLIDACALLRGL